MAVITGDANDNVLRGLSGSDSVYGLDGNDTLSGPGTLFGGNDDDTYIMYQKPFNIGNTYTISNSISEQANQGYDTLIINVDPLGGNIYTLTTKNIEHFVISGNIAWTVGSNSDDEIEIHPTQLRTTILDGVIYNDAYQISGGDGNDTLWGSEYDDQISGDRGVDFMIGGKGNDLYVVDSKFDSIIEMSSGGHDSVECYAKEFKLQNWVEDLYAYGDKGAIGLNFEGNFSNNHIEITGDFNRIVKAWSGDDYVSTAGGNDFLTGDGGSDTLVGGLGNDVYRSDMGANENDLISDVGGADDSIELMNTNYNQIWFAHVGDDLKIYNLEKPNSSATIQNWFTSTTARVETIYANGNWIDGNRLDDLISVMSKFSIPSSSTENTNSTVTKAIQADWN